MMNAVVLSRDCPVRTNQFIESREFGAHLDQGAGGWNLLEENSFLIVH
jgi:hypothetical protein